MFLTSSANLFFLLSFSSFCYPFHLFCLRHTGLAAFPKLNKHTSSQGFGFCWSLCQKKCFPLHGLLPYSSKVCPNSPPYVKIETYYSHHFPIPLLQFTCLFSSDYYLTHNIFFLFLLFTFCINYNNISSTIKFPVPRAGPGSQEILNTYC